MKKDGTDIESLVAEVTRPIPDEELIAEAERRGYIIHRPAPPKAETLSLDHLSGRKRVRFGIVSCTHLGSRYQQLTALREFAAYCRRQRVDAMIHAGDITDGPTSRHRNPHEVFLHTYDAALEYTAQHLPRIGRPWYIISGNHDDWWLLSGGPEVGRALATARDDITYLGRSHGYLLLGETRVEIVHLNKGTSYAYSYQPQRHIEALSIERRPHVSLIGNFHKFCALYYRNVYCIQLPSFQAQTPWMATKSLVSEVGGVILDIGLHPKGLAPVVRIETVWTFEPREDDF